MARKNPDITVAEIRSLIDFTENPVWKVSFPPHVKAGDLVGTVDIYGLRRQASIRGVRKQVSHIVWFAYNGYWPDKHLVIDHIDGDPSNNRIDNLRLVTHKVNNERRKRVPCVLEISDGRKFPLGLHLEEHHHIVKETAIRMIALLEKEKQC
ncbi:MAG: hypothetical protein Unbinned200contig1000_32 [Prokaryotic dsDNA virus sp.]|jgi:hypothetical protein|nr:hypothetical protein [Flavobacteriaceae bacterium]QDP65292.1 MAG: hypothetical protein Unbinned200contig1000_32 [Prokaryotic dsDNA virus sp.]|tara:strand:+ start:40132 stop:40587 length:456 start_codon:yes stop_codon:yes gene_type:complete